MSDHGVIWICRDIPGDHVGGPDCFCCPVVMDPFDELDVLRVENLIEGGMLGQAGLA